MEKTKAAKQTTILDQFHHGDLLRIKHHESKPGKGLSYPDMTVIATDHGMIGGWDVYDGILEPLINGRQDVSFYGFSIISIESRD